MSTPASPRHLGFVVRGSAAHTIILDTLTICISGLSLLGYIESFSLGLEHLYTDLTVSFEGLGIELPLTSAALN